MVIKYKIFKINNLNIMNSNVLCSFDSSNDTFDTKEECIEQIKNFGNPDKQYTITKIYIF